MAMQIFSRILCLILPAFCPICQALLEQSGRARLCPACRDQITMLDGPCCPRCGRPFSSPVTLTAPPGYLCGDCRLTPPFFDQAVAATPYAEVIAQAIHLFKYQKRRSLVAPLGNLLSRAADRLSPADLVIPVPLHIRRLREREFNQSLLLARRVAQHLRLPLLIRALVRTRWTTPQVELTGEKRRRNVLGSFALTHKNKVEGKRVILVDDVYTTGSTVNECARVLKKGGAEAVYILTVARTAKE